MIRNLFLINSKIISKLWCNFPKIGPNLDKFASKDSENVILSRQPEISKGSQKTLSFLKLLMTNDEPK